MRTSPAVDYAALDDPDNTFLWLDRAVLDGSPIGTMPLEPAFDKFLPIRASSNSLSGFERLER